MNQNQWKEDLERLLRLSGNRDPSDLIKDICDLAARIGEDAAETLLEAHPELFKYKPALTQAYCRRVLSREAPEVQRLLGTNSGGPAAFKDVASELGLALYNRSLEMFDKLDLSTCRRLVMVGCGSLPFTVFLIHDKTTIPEIVGLDIRPEAVESARDMAERLSYGRVRTELCDGRSYDYSQAQIVYVAGMVSPKSAIMSRIADTAPDDVQIVVREPFSLGRLWLESSEHGRDRRLEVTAKGRGEWTLNRDIFLRRRTASTSGA